MSGFFSSLVYILAKVKACLVDHYLSITHFSSDKANLHLDGQLSSRAQ